MSDIDEGKSTGMSAIQIFGLVLVISVIIAFLLFAIAKFNSGQAKLSEAFNSLDTAEFTSYSESEITGDMLRSAVSAFINKDVVMVVDSDSTHFTNASPVATVGGTLPCAMPTAFPTAAQAYNIGSIASQTGSESSAQLIGGTDGKIYVQVDPDASGSTVTTRSTTKNMNLKPLQLKTAPSGGAANPNYVAPGAKYWCQLIYDPSTKTACGVLFTKMK